MDYAWFKNLKKGDPICWPETGFGSPRGAYVFGTVARRSPGGGVVAVPDGQPYEVKFNKWGETGSTWHRVTATEPTPKVHALAVRAHQIEAADTLIFRLNEARRDLSDEDKLAIGKMLQPARAILKSLKYSK